eukprot:TRINITY_DN4156_c0_g1_i2.p1 TRINITY_DN4156_c0_g1~~TRINITY_DN4156_c0_g1_i2.p1  ORF type:complete len:214 (+),score=14.51 TRINITY_DN4156_c0_g1_i2:291-932(+)
MFYLMCPFTPAAVTSISTTSQCSNCDVIPEGASALCERSSAVTMNSMPECSLESESDAMSTSSTSSTTSSSSTSDEEMHQTFCSADVPPIGSETCDHDASRKTITTSIGPTSIPGLECPHPLATVKKRPEVGVNSFAYGYQQSLDDEVASQDSGPRGPPTSRETAYDCGYSPDVSLRDIGSWSYGHVPRKARNKNFSIFIYQDTASRSKRMSL